MRTSLRKHLIIVCNESTFSYGPFTFLFEQNIDLKPAILDYTHTASMDDIQFANNYESAINRYIFN
jgi:hypothetical protein